eukprot:gene6453-11899_t
MTSSANEPFKIVLLGDEGVGKTEDAYSKKITLDGKTHIIEVLDTANKGEGTTRRKEFMLTANAFIIAFSTIDSISFQSVLRYKRIIEQYSRHDDIHIGLIGTKSDLTHLRQVPRNEAQSFATIYGWLYSESSAANDINVQGIFHSIIRAGKGESGLPKNVPERPMNRKKSIFNKLSSQFMRKRSYSKPIDVPAEIVQNGNGFAKNSMSSLSVTANVKQYARRRSYSFTTVI